MIILNPSATLQVIILVPFPDLRVIILAPLAGLQVSVLPLAGDHLGSPWSLRGELGLLPPTGWYNQPASMCEVERE